MRAALQGWRDGRGPLYRRLALSLGAAIDRGALLRGTRLPPERALAAELAISRGTVVAAYDLLRRSGAVTRRQGRGTEIAGAEAGRRAVELSASLGRNVVFRGLGAPADDVIDLVSGPAAPSGPARDAVRGAFAAVDPGALVADEGYHPLGLPALRRAVAAHLTAQGLPTAPDQVLITNGAQQAISLVATYLLGPNEVVVLEDPTFPGAIDAARTVGARVLTVPAHRDGVDVPVLAATLARNTVRAVYLMPTFHNPTGAVMGEGARREVARLSEATGTPVVEDLTLAELALEDDPPPPIAAFSSTAPIVSIGSLSKLFWGGLRVGWVRADATTIGQLGRLKAVADLGGSVPSQAIAVELLPRAAAIRRARRRELGERLALLGRRLEELLPDWRWDVPPGGVTVWARLPFGSATDLAQVAKAHGVSVAPGTVMSAIGGFDEFVRLPFGQPPELLEQGLARLARAWTEYAAHSTRPLTVVV